MKNNQNAAKKKNILERLEELERVNSEKDDQIRDLTERLVELENKKLETNNIVEEGPKIFQISTINCTECDFNTKLSSDLEKHITDNHLSCEFCDFVGKNLTGLKIHIRRMHSN